MEQEGRRMVGRCFGSAVVGPRGQLVVPVEARKEMGIDAGTKLLVFSLFQGRGLIFVKVEALQDLLNIMGRRVDEFAKLVREGETAADIRTEDEGNRS